MQISPEFLMLTPDKKIIKSIRKVGSSYLQLDFPEVLELSKGKFKTLMEVYAISMKLKRKRNRIAKQAGGQVLAIMANSHRLSNGKLENKQKCKQPISDRPKASEFAAKKNVSEEVRLSKFLDSLKIIFKEGFVTFGHGTIAGLAKKANKTGLEAKSPVITSTAIYLINSEKSLAQILNWPHLKAKAIVIVLIPEKLLKRQPGAISEDEPLWEELPNSGPYENKYRLPDKFVFGWIDVENRRIYKNPNFEADLEKYKLSDYILPKRPVGPQPSAHMAKEPIEIPAPSTDQNAKIPDDVW